MFFIVKYFGHEIGFNTIKPINSRIAVIHKIPSPTTKIELMRFIGSMNFSFIFIDNLLVNMKPLSVLLPDNIKFLWNIELETLSQRIKVSITKIFLL